MVVSLNYCSQNGGNVYRAPYYNGNPNIGPRIIGNLDQSPNRNPTFTSKTPNPKPQTLNPERKTLGPAFCQQPQARADHGRMREPVGVVLRLGFF